MSCSGGVFETFVREAVGFVFQCPAPSAGQPEYAAFVAAFFAREADAAVAVAGPGAGIGNAEKQ